MNESWIGLQNVSVYIAGREGSVLTNLSLDIRAGEWLTVAGRNGCGKSVLGKLLAGLEGRYTGQIHRAARGQPSKVRWVMQNPEAQLIGETVWEDLLFGLENLGLSPEMIHTTAADALRSVGMQGLEGRHVHHLSGGQKQLLALAGAIAMKPSVLVADEVTSMLDPSSRGRVLEVLRELNRQGVAIVMITQLLEEAVHSGRLVAMDQGTVAYDGDIQDFFYAKASGGQSRCEILGLLPPYPVRVAQELQKRGIPVQGRPLTVEALEKAVSL